MTNLRSLDKKNTTLRAFLKNKNLGTLIQKALDSPLGSTDRKRVQKIISIINKTKQDGAGGLGKLPPVQDQQLRQKEIDYSNFVIFPNFSKKGGSQMQDGAGGPGSLGDFGYGSQYESIRPTGGVTTPSLGGKITTPPIFASSVGKDTSLAETPKYDLFPWRTQKPTPSVESITSTPTTKVTQTPFGEIGQTLMSTDTSGAQKPVTPVTPVAPTTKAPLTGVQQAVQDQTGATMFTYQSLSNPEYLKTLSGFKDLPEELLNAAPTLSERLVDLSNSLRSSNHLDSLLGQYNSLALQGVGLEGFLTNYITERDEFLNQTDQMLEGFKDKVLTMDLANPETYASAEMYNNYLYELRGRQNKRYIEFLNSSISQYTEKLDSTARMYEIALNNYQQELTTKSAITQEEYGMMFNALTEMYTNVENAPAMAFENLKAQTELEQAQVSLALDYIKLNGEGFDGGETYLEALKNLSNENVGLILDDGTLNPNFSYSDIEWLEAQGVSSKANTFSAMINIGRKSMLSSDEEEGFPSLDSIMQIAGSVLGMINEAERDGQFVNNPEQVINYMEQVQDSVLQAIKQGEEIDAGAVRRAVNYLSKSHPGWLNIGALGGESPTREDLSDHMKNAGLNELFLDTLYSDFEETKDDPESFAQDFFTHHDGVAKDDNAIVQTLIQSFVDKLSNTRYLSSRGQERDFNVVGGDTNQASQTQKVALATGNRPQRNNNPLNIKVSSNTKEYQGVVDVDPSPATDGGHFLVFDTIQNGFDAASRLLKTSGYLNLSVNEALKRWSNNGYGGEIIPDLKNKIVKSLTSDELNSLVLTMAKREGFYDNYT